jgi:hypothetical protein
MEKAEAIYNIPPPGMIGDLGVCRVRRVRYNLPNLRLIAEARKIAEMI